MRVSRRAVIGCALSIAGAVGAGPTVWASGEPTPAELLADAAERSAAVPSRFEMFVALEGPGISSPGDEPLATGEIDGTSSHIVVDLSAALGSAAAVLGDIDWTMEIITLGKTMYIKAPLLADLAEMTGSSSGPLAAFVELADGWGSVDLGSLTGASAEQLTSMLGGTGASPAAFYTVLATTSKLTPLGVADVNGVSSSGYETVVDLGDILAAEGTDAAASDPAAVTGIDVPFEVWLGDDGYIRRMAYEMDAEATAAAAAASGQDADDVDDTTMRMQLDSFDFDDPSIVIEAPPDATDITDAYAALLEFSSP
jgi:hypothetical protein